MPGLPQEPESEINTARLPQLRWESVQPLKKPSLTHLCLCTSQPLGQTTLHKVTQSLGQTTPTQSDTATGSDNTYTNWHSHWVRQHLHKLTQLLSQTPTQTDTVSGSDNTYTNWQSLGQITSTQTDTVSGVRHTDQWGPPSFWQLAWRCRRSASRCTWHPRWWRWSDEDRSCSWTCLSPGATAHSAHCKHST